MKLEISVNDWNAIRLLVREEERACRDNYGLPGRKGKTWEAEYQEANPRAFRILVAALQGITRAKVSR